MGFGCRPSKHAPKRPGVVRAILRYQSPQERPTELNIRHHMTSGPAAMRIALGDVLAKKISSEVMGRIYDLTFGRRDSRLNELLGGEIREIELTVHFFMSQQWHRKKR